MASENQWMIFGLIGFIVGAVFSAGIFVWMQPELATGGSEPNSNPVLDSQLTPLPSETYSATIGIVAVSQATNEGITNSATVEIRPGSGRILVALNPFTEPDTQQSAEIAASVAQKITQKDLSEFDLVYSIESNASLVGGPSAGAALAVATIAAIEQKQVRSNAAITGTIQADGSIGQIGGIVEKTDAVGKAGKKLFLVPVGQSKVIYYEPKETVEQRGPIRIVRRSFVPKQLDLVAYAKSEYGLKVREVATISDAVESLLE